MEQLPEDPLFTYSQASQTVGQYGEFLRRTMHHGVDISFADEQSQHRFVEAYQKIRSMSQVHQVLTRMRGLAQTKPEEFFNNGEIITGYDEFAWGDSVVRNPVHEYDPYKRVCYNFLTGAYPARHNPNNPDTQQAINIFKDRRRQELLEGELEKLPNLRIMAGESKYVGTGNFFWVGGAEREPGSPGCGKLFLNPLPQQAHRVFLEAAKAFSGNPQLAWTMKMADPGGKINSLAIDRADKIVLYFSPFQEAIILNILRNLYTKLGITSFDDTIPALAAHIRDSNRTPMRGIGFGQEPDRQFKESSFNNRRESVFLDLQRTGYSINSVNYEEKLKMAFKNYGINSVNPVFNDPPQAGENLFPAFKASLA